MRVTIRVEVNMTHGNQMNVANTAVVAVRPQPRVVTGQLLSTDEQAVFAWVTLNEAPLVSYWNGVIDTATLVGRLRRV